MRNGIVDEITKLVLDKVKTENYDLVMDRSGLSLNGVPILMFAKDGLDFSDDIITRAEQEQAEGRRHRLDTPATRPCRGSPVELRKSIFYRTLAEKRAGTFRRAFSLSLP